MTTKTTRVTFDSDRLMSVCGVPGRLTHRTVKPGQADGLWFKQRWVSERRPASADYPAGCTIQAELQFDDACGNGRNCFAITANVRRASGKDEAGGCLHEDVAAAFPELAHLIPWHLTFTDGPMHYVANTLYHAGDTDHNGLREGERRQLKSGRTGLLSWRLTRADTGADATTADLPRYVDSAEQPAAPVGFEYAPWYLVGEGKPRNLEAARRTAVWPDATDEQLTAPRAELEHALLERLPALLAAFRHDMEAAGFFWSPADYHDTREVGYTIRSEDGRKRASYRPDWSASQPWVSYTDGVAGRHFATEQQAVAWINTAEA